MSAGCAADEPGQQGRCPTGGSVEQARLLGRLPRRRVSQRRVRTGADVLTGVDLAEIHAATQRLCERVHELAHAHGLGYELGRERCEVLVDCVTYIVCSSVALGRRP